MRRVAIILAGGIGSRVGSQLPKQFLEVLGKPIIAYSLESFEFCDAIDDIVLVCLKEYIPMAKKICQEYCIKKVKKVVAGGEDFLHSCINGMNYLVDICDAEDIVVISSADRPFVSQEEIEDSINVCRLRGSGIAARKCSLCMFMVGTDKSHSNNYQRDNLMQIATPWSFAYGLLKNALDEFERGKLHHCELYPPAIFVAAGNEAYFSLAKPQNFKITEKSDVALMEQIIKERQNHE